MTQSSILNWFGSKAANHRPAQNPTTAAPATVPALATTNPPEVTNDNANQRSMSPSAEEEAEEPAAAVNEQPDNEAVVAAIVPHLVHQVHKKAKRGQSDGQWLLKQDLSKHAKDHLASRPFLAINSADETSVDCLACILAAGDKATGKGGKPLKGTVLSRRVPTLTKHEADKKHLVNLEKWYEANPEQRPEEDALVQKTLPEIMASPTMQDALTLSERRKVMQLMQVFKTLRLGNRIEKHEQDLFKAYQKRGFLGRQGCPSGHWSDDSLWGMVEAIDKVEVERMTKILKGALMLGVTMDESTSGKNQYLSSHVYYVDKKYWKRKPVFIKLGEMTDGADASNIAKVFYESIAQTFGILKEELKAKLVCHATDGANVMKGHLTRVNSILVEKSPLSLFVWCTAHRLSICGEPFVMIA